MNFRRRFLLLHSETGLSLEKDAEQAGVNVHTFRSYARPSTEAKPGYEAIMKLARHYDVSTDYLLGVSDTRRRFGE